MKAVNNLCLANRVCTFGRRQPEGRSRHASLSGVGAVAEAAAGVLMNAKQMNSSQSPTTYSG